MHSLELAWFNFNGGGCDVGDGNLRLIKLSAIGMGISGALGIRAEDELYYSIIYWVFKDAVLI